MFEKKVKTDILKCNILQNDYKIISNILSNVQNIITKNENILLFSKNQTMKILNDLIKNLNETYNINIINILSLEKTQKENINIEKNIIEIKKISDNESQDIDLSDSILSSDSENSIENNSSYKINEIDLVDNNDVEFEEDETSLELIYKIRILNLENNINEFGKFNLYKYFLDFDPFKDIKEKIILLCKIVGFTNFNDIIYLNFNINNFTIENNNIYDLLSKNLVITDFKILDHNPDIKNIIIEKDFSNNILLFNNYCNIKINIFNKTIKFFGFFNYDSLNINLRTSQICNSYLFEKKTLFEKIIKFEHNKYLDDYLLKKLKRIDSEFSDIYLKNINLVNLLSFNDTLFIESLYEDFNKFNELNKIQFIKLIKLFTKDVDEDLSNMYNIIRILLLGDESNCSIASLLFNLLKDKRSSTSNDSIANIIYNQLNYVAQIKLKKTVFNIKKELDKLKNITTMDIDLKKQILLSKNMPEHIKKICLDKYDELKNSNNETYKIKMYINILVQFPWLSDQDDNIFKLVADDKNKSKEFLEDVQHKLDKQIYGHEVAKNKTIQILGKLISVQGSHISPIALAGPPGVGKTKFAQCLAESLDIPFVQITLGGQNDGELLHGHGYTYSGAQPGLIVKKMVDAGSGRCIMYFDELDKCVSKNGQVNELMSILIHLTDPMTNGSFQDRFFQEITFPLNKVIFMFSFNDISKIDKILKDRMEIIDVSSYSINEKIKISQDYLLKELFKEIGFQDKTIIFQENILNHIIENYTFEPGVRSLRRSLENILLKLNIDKIYQRGKFEINSYDDKNPLIIDKDIVSEFLGETKVEYNKIHANNMIGIVNGLYATTLCSGGIVPIQLIGHHFGENNKFTLKLTGNQKKVMKESVFYAFTTAINLLTEEGKKIFYDNYPNGIHIHTPEAATPKDGPSAGVAFTLGFLSLMLNLKVDKELALTGEVDLLGNATKIGGVKYKVQGGFKAGVKKIFLPSSNKEDVDKTKKELPEIFDNEHECFFMDHALDVAKVALIDFDSKKHLLKNYN
jgi:endopeptidase La